MKQFICIAVSLLALALTPAFGQIPGIPNPAKFDLDFPGGTPTDLIQAIEKTTGKPMNVIIPTADADTQLPELKMNGVNIPQLFDALEAASKKVVVVETSRYTGGSSYTQQQTDYGFRTADNPVTDNSVWYFYVNQPTLPEVASTQSTCRFYQLQPYLDHGFSVDDITTAIQTGWKMAGITSPPQLNYHKETNLLIAYGKPDDLYTIQSVLDSLPKIYLDSHEFGYIVTQADKVKVLESQIHELSDKVSALEKNSGK